ncbi:hypothetical protein [Campylobacter estrildidarum]|uniref:Flagellar protein FliL n=1 Tax=Campylobacter estrildidarum TaxID=2510189 RepID=A0A4U7BJR4_9BACT|nr:hypothetical protein [Campylobacter estrildidarum]TKX30671.1 hypothetical protein CQA69_05415 [Campylobacter estrildidarum]
MKKIFFAIFLFLNLNAQSLEISKLRTDLYSKSGANILKKVEISLDFEGENLKENELKLIDSINTVISGFFYEDLFTEIGKDNFKKVLKKFIEKKYKMNINEIYILSLSGVEKFDLEEFKRFLQSTEAKKKNASSEVKKVLENLSVPEVPQVKTPNNISIPNIPEAKQIGQLFGDGNEDKKDDGEISSDSLNIPKINPSELEEKIKQDLIKNPPKIFQEKNITKTSPEENSSIGFDLKLDNNSTK